ncbi:MAG: Gfo/Idh/MocA family oxidoreductase, partial [Bdellovibrionales bacterium]|nr:Gfo/Idh/MocA family oxidoreductase [Bdellovibrionales bacterium]
MIRFGVVGAKRATLFAEIEKHCSEQIKLCALHDINSEALKQWKKLRPDLSLFEDYSALISSGACDAIFIASPIEYHAAQSIQALGAGLHVLCEIPAITTLQEASELRQAARSARGIFALAENYCFIEENLIIKQLCDSGTFGEISLVEGSYIHDCKDLMFSEKGDLTWRGVTNAQFQGDRYPTHAFGPIGMWLSLGLDDKLVHLTSFATKDLALKKYAQQRFPDRFDDTFHFARGDSVHTVLQTEAGVLINLRLDTKSNRPSAKNFHSIQGTNGFYSSGRFDSESHVIWLVGDDGPPTKLHEHPVLASLPDLIPTNRKNVPINLRAHCLLLDEFISAVNLSGRPSFGVDAAIQWSAITPLSEAS